MFPDVPITKKPLEVRMGSGKGNVEYWVAKVKPGKVLFEMEGVTEEMAREAFRLGRRQALGVDDVREAAGALMKASEMSARRRPAAGAARGAAEAAQGAVRAAPAARDRARRVKPDQFGKVRKNIARVKTVLRARDREARRRQRSK